MSERIAVVTGASSGIGAATARALANDGFRVFCAARRADRIEALAAEIGGVAVPCDTTDPEQVAALAAQVGGRCDVLVNNAGMALGLDPVMDGNPEGWRQMYEVNVLGTLRVTQALLPAVEACEGAIIFTTSTAAEYGYEGGAGYCGSKSAMRSLVESLRLEMCGRPLRICEVVPGMVATEEFSLTRFAGDQERADAVYAGVELPLTDEDVAEAFRWIASLPKHVNVDRIVLRPRAQAAQFKLHRG